jgi:pimeloyl-ACP methyl ester carboxylesterase
MSRPKHNNRISPPEVLVGSDRLPGFLVIPPAATGLVVFVHGSGSSRFSTRNREVADDLNRVGMATLLFDLLSPGEELARDRALVFDIPFLAARLEDAVHWTQGLFTPGFPVGLFGASTGAAAALVAASRLGSRISAIVSRGGRPDLADSSLEQVRAPTLLIVGGADEMILELNRQALHRLRGISSLQIIPGATHLFPEPGAMEQVRRLATAWFERYLAVNPD